SRRRHTRSKRDWSSDVCSSDLPGSGLPVRYAIMRELPIRDITEHDDNCVRRVPIFSGLTTEQQDLVATVARPQILSAGELVHGAGERTGKMFVVHTGEIKLSRTL